MSNITEGPWEVRNERPAAQRGSTVVAPSAEDRFNDAGHYGAALVAETCTTADARLIAAAPDLLAALERAREFICEEQGWIAGIPVVAEFIDPAIAKAKGGAR